MFCPNYEIHLLIMVLFFIKIFKKKYPYLPYGKYSKNSNTKASDKMTYANSVDPDQTAPEGAVWSGSTLFAIPLII